MFLSISNFPMYLRSEQNFKVGSSRKFFFPAATNHCFASVPTPWQESIWFSFKALCSEQELWSASEAPV